jgi:hypothetical protein
MTISFSVMQIFGLVVAGIVAGAALLMLFLNWISGRSSDEPGVGCAGIGFVLLAVAVFLAIRILAAG